MYTRAEFQQRAEGVILSARALLAPGVGRWSDAYYLIGYATECGLKSCIVKRLAAAPEVFFIEKDLRRDAWTHDLEALVRAADLKAVRDAEASANPALGKN